MRIFESLGYTPESGVNRIVVGYFFEGENGKYAFSFTKPASSSAKYDIDLDTSAPYIRDITS